MKFHLESSAGTHPVVVFDEEPDPIRSGLLYMFMRDVDRNEDLYLADFDTAENGTPVLDIGNHYVWVSMYPDGRVVIERMERLLDDDEKDNPPQTVITIAEARKLILDWLEAEKQWYAEREAREQTVAEQQPATKEPAS